VAAAPIANVASGTAVTASLAPKHGSEPQEFAIYAVADGVYDALETAKGAADACVADEYKGTCVAEEFDDPAVACVEELVAG
jgi:hypothetical protein